jgi:hypothetical protein
MHDRPYDCGHPFVEPAPQPAPSGAVSFCPHGTPVCANCLGNVNEEDGPAPSGDEAAIGRFAPTEPKSQWCRNCGLHISRHREQVMHAARCPVDAGHDASATSGDEAKAIAEAFLARHGKRLDDFCHSASRGEYGAGQIDYVLTDLVMEAARAAYAAGKADGAREEREACRMAAERRICAEMCGHGDCDKARKIRDAIARRGSERT